MEKEIYKLIRPVEINNKDQNHDKLYNAHREYHLGEFTALEDAMMARRELMAFLEELKREIGESPLNSVNINEPLTKEQCEQQENWFEKRESIINSIVWPPKMLTVPILN